MKQRFIPGLRAVISRKNLLFSNAILCLCYPLCYILLILLPYGNTATTSSFYTGGVVVLNIIFLLIMALNINTVTVVYSQLLKPKRYIRVVYWITVSVLSCYLFTAYYLLLNAPGFLRYFHHYIRYSFGSMHISMMIVSLVFLIGMSLLYSEYYRQIKIKYILSFIVPALCCFAFKSTMPFLLYILAWAVFSGCQLLLYYSIVDISVRKKVMGHLGDSADCIVTH